MQIVAIGSRVFITSFQLAGVQGLTVDSPSKALTEIKKLSRSEDIGLVLLSDDISKDIHREEQTLGQRLLCP